MEPGGSHFPVLHAPHGTELNPTTLWPSTVEGQSADSGSGEGQGPGGGLGNYLEAVGVFNDNYSSPLATIKIPHLR